MAPNKGAELGISCKLNSRCVSYGLRLRYRRTALLRPKSATLLSLSQFVSVFLSGNSLLNLQNHRIVKVGKTNKTIHSNHQSMPVITENHVIFSYVDSY